MKISSGYESIDFEQRTKNSRKMDAMNYHGRDMGSCSPPSDTETVSHPVKRRKRSKYCNAIDKICDVCGDVAKSMHFGGMACDSCKAFFRRSVQNDSYKTFKCGAQKSCPVIKDNRRICQFCRFQKCLDVGMEVKWVMSEADRMSLWKSKLTKHRQKTGKRTSTCSESDSTCMDSSNPQTALSFSMILRPEEQTALEHLVTLQELAFAAMPYPEDCLGDTPASMANLFFCICQKLRSFFFRLDDFHEIPKVDQPIVLRNGIAMSIYLHGAYNYDVEKQTWPAPNIKEALRLPFITTDTLRLFTVYPEMYDTLMDFYNEYGNDLKDEVVLVLLCLITLFHDNECELSARAYIQNLNNRYICLLRNYLQHNKGERIGNCQLTRLLNSLIAIKKITSYHRVVDISHSVDTNQLITKGSLSLRDQMVAVSLLLNHALTSDIPKFASALSPDEALDMQLTRRNQQLTFRRPQFLPDPRIDLYFHHPVTNSLFGTGVRTDKLLSFNHKSIISFKKSIQALQMSSSQNSLCSNEEDTRIRDSSPAIRCRDLANFDYRKIKCKEEVGENIPYGLPTSPQPMLVDDDRNESNLAMRERFQYMSKIGNYGSDFPNSDPSVMTDRMESSAASYSRDDRKKVVREMPPLSRIPMDSYPYESY